MIHDKVRFIAEEMVQYEKYELYFGSADNSIVKKWYLLDEHKELHEMKEFGGAQFKSFRVPGYQPVAGKHFYKKKMKNLRIEKKIVFSAFKQRDL